MTGKSNLPLWDATTDKLSFNIAAEDGKTAAEGCFRPRNPDAVRPCKVLVSFASSQDHDDVYKDLYIHHSSSHQHNFTNTIPETNLQLRGWCFQELMMSSRILRFGRNQVSWCCSCAKASEAFPAGAEHNSYDRYKSFKVLLLRACSHCHSNERTPTRPHYVWYWLVENFIGRSLTRNTDTLPALSGLAKEFQSLTRDKYCAGLWYNNLFEGLCWRRPEMLNDEGPRDSTLERDLAYVAHLVGHGHPLTQMLSIGIMTNTKTHLWSSFLVMSISVDKMPSEKSVKEYWDFTGTL
jgi:hypothetical protein